jgi:hypothetical protein
MGTEPLDGGDVQQKETTAAPVGKDSIESEASDFEIHLDYGGQGYAADDFRKLPAAESLNEDDQSNLGPAGSECCSISGISLRMDENEAATLIQARVKGHLARKNMRQCANHGDISNSNAGQTQENVEPCLELQSVEIKEATAEGTSPASKYHK